MVGMDHRISEPLNKIIIIRGLGKSLFSKNFIFHQRINSTNKYIKELAIKGAPEGTIVLAEEQTRGKGRLNRKWLSQGHENLLFSILLRPLLEPNNIFLLTMILAVSVIDTIKDITGLDVLVKWPNDLYIIKKKLAGILTEFSIKEDLAEYVIIGLGLNVNWMPGENDGLLYPATSILAESGISVSRNELLIGILKRFEHSYDKALTGKTDDLHRRWKGLSMVIGRDVEIISQNGSITGKVMDIERNGALILKNSTHGKMRILSGDVSLRF